MCESLCTHSPSGNRDKRAHVYQGVFFQVAGDKYIEGGMNVCLALVMLLDVRFHRLAPLMTNILEYRLLQTQDENEK